jgi:hypothetical protein
MLNAVYAESFMFSVIQVVTYLSVMLSIIMLNVILLYVIMPSVVGPV